mgnify:CR=1 FL=1
MFEDKQLMVKCNYREVIRMADISIPEGDNPVRYQAALGGNQKYRNMGNISGQAYLVRGQVTNVYYQKGTLEFNTYGSSIASGTTDGSGSAPIPVDFWGKNTDGKVFGCYRPVQKGSQILVAYIGGDTSRPIVIGVYPANEASYELISPVHYNTGDDSTDDVQNDALGERKIYPNQQMMYESGKGDILRSMGGKSFLYISENGNGYLDDINYAYDEIRDFYDADANEIEPTMTKAQSWLLVHEDNDSDEASDGHRTRFYVNRSGELMVTFANKDDPNNIVVLEASKDSGFKLTKRFDNSNLKEDSEDYVQFGIGNGNNVSIKSVDSGDATSFYLDNGNIKFDTPKEGSITFDGIPVSAILGRVSDAENVANNASDKATVAASAGAIAQSAASEAASQALAASLAGEDAKRAAVDAQAAGEGAKAQAKDTRDRIIYYSSISNEKDVAIPGKYIIINTDTYIKNGTIKTAHIGDAAITNAKIADLAVGTAQLEDAAITRAKIGNLAVGTAQIEDAAITDAKVGTLSANHLNAGTIDFSVISGIHINASEIDVGKIVADQIFVNGLGDISKNLGTITSGNITGTNINNDVDNLNDPNLMSVIEKQTTAKQYAGLTSQYNVILARAKDDNISTTALTTAYNNLDTFMTPLLADTTKASNIDRYTYNDLTYTYNMALSNVQNALKEAYNTDISNMQSNVAVASQAASSAVIVASQATVTGNSASQVASQVAVVASQAQIAGSEAVVAGNQASQAASNAAVQASVAVSNANVANSNATSGITIARSAANDMAAVSEAVTALKGGSTLTIEQLENGLRTKITAGDITGGGRNYIADSTNVLTINGDTDHYKILYYNLAPGTWTFSANAKYTSGAATAVSVLIYNAGHSKQIGTNNDATLVNGRIQVTFTITDSSAKELLVYAGNNGYWSTTGNILQIDHYQLETGIIAHDWQQAPEDFSQLVETKTADLAETMVKNSDFTTYKDQTASTIGTLITSDDAKSEMIQTINNASVGFKNADGTSYQIALSADGIALMDVSKLIINGQTSIMDATIGTAQIADAAITNAKIGKLAVGTAQIANAAITDAQIGNINADKITAGTIDFSKIEGTNINASNITTGKLSADRVNVDQLSALSADLGDITTGSLKGVNIVANTFSTPNGSFTTDANGAITANNMTIKGGTLTSPTINAGTINGATINGTTFHGGTQLNQYGNTSYPLTINPDGSITSTSFETNDIETNVLRTVIKNGILTLNQRGVTPIGSAYGFINSMIGYGTVQLYEGSTSSPDPNFNKDNPDDRTGWVELSASTGLNLGGETFIRFGGSYQDTDAGIIMDSYGNISGNSHSGWWRISDSAGNQVANFGTAPGNNVTFPKPISTDEISGFSTSNSNELLIHGYDDGNSGSTGQMRLYKDERSAIVASKTIYNRTYSSGSAVMITGYGTLGRITSASKYKLDITKETSISPANKLLSIDMSSWVDKSAAESLADSKTNGTELSEPEINVNRRYGLIAEDLIKAGLNEFVIKGDNGQAEGIEYDRLWITLIPKIRQLSNENIQNKMTISRLENEIENIKQGR